MTALALNYERRMGRPFDHTRSRLHSFSGAARGMLPAVFLHDPEASIFRPSGKTARNIEELVGGATSTDPGPPPITQIAFLACRAHYPGGPVRVLAGFFPAGDLRHWGAPIREG